MGNEKDSFDKIYNDDLDEYYIMKIAETSMCPRVTFGRFFFLLGIFPALFVFFNNIYLRIPFALIGLYIIYQICKTWGDFAFAVSVFVICLTIVFAFDLPMIIVYVICTIATIQVYFAFKYHRKAVKRFFEIIDKEKQK